MNNEDKFFIIVLIFFTILFIFNMYMLVRQGEVFVYRLDKIVNDFENYKKLPSNNYMLWHFWVWPLDKFLPKEEEINDNL